VLKDVVGVERCRAVEAGGVHPDTIGEGPYGGVEAG
jgi:hypothetical protein